MILIPNNDNLDIEFLDKIYLSSFEERDENKIYVSEEYFLELRKQIGHSVMVCGEIKNEI